MSLKNWLRFCAVGFIWGSTFVWVKIAIREVGPNTLVAYRVLFSVLALSIYALFRRPGRLRASLVMPAVVLAFFNLLIPQVLISWSEQHIPSWLASILVSAVPFLTTLFAVPLFIEEKLTPRRVTGLLLGFVGVVVLLGGQVNQGGPANFWGALAVLGAAACFAFSNVYTRARARHIPSMWLTFWMMIPAAVVILPLAMVTEGPLALPKEPATWAALAWLGLLNGGVAMVFFYSLIQSIGSARTSLVAYTYPLVGVVLGILFLREEPGWHLMLGGAFIVAGVLVFILKNQKVVEHGR